MRATAGAIALAVAAATAHAASGPPRISVHPRAGLWDGPLEIVVSHLQPHERGVLRAVTSDERGRGFASSTAVRADSHGRIALEGPRATPVLWSMHPPYAGPAEYYVYVPPLGGERVRITLEVGRRVVARASLTRRLLAAGERSRSLRPASTGFFGELFRPARTSTRRPGILLFGGSEGGLSLANDAALLAAHGYPTLALAYFAEPGLPKNLLRIPLEYFANALHWFGRQPGVDPAGLVVAGTSRGSEAAQLLGVHYPRLVHAVVALVPSNAAVCGIPRFTPTARSSSTAAGSTRSGRPGRWRTRSSRASGHTASRTR